MFKFWRKKQAVKVEVINAIELRKDSTYILVANTTQVKQADIQSIMANMRRAGIKNVVGFMLSGAPEDAIQFVTQEKKAHATKKPSR